MRRSVIWFVLSAGWGLDCILAAFRRNWMQAALTCFFALCFFGIGLLFHRRDGKAGSPR